MNSPLRIIVAGYGLAAIAAAAVWIAGFGLAAAILVSWLGGALCVIALAVATPWFRAAEADAATSTASCVSVAELEAWEADRAADSATAAQTSRRTG